MRKAAYLTFIMLFLPALAAGLGTRISNGHYWQRDPSVQGNMVVWSDLRDYNGEIFYYNIATGKEAKIEPRIGYLDIYPAVYGRNVVYWHTSTVFSPKATGLYLYDLSTNAEKNISSIMPAESGKPQIYGNRIVWGKVWSAIGQHTLGTARFYDISDGNETALSSDSSKQFFPKIDGNRAVWSDTRYGSTDVFLYDFATNQEKQITKGSSSPTFNTVAWAPDISGDKIVWFDRGGNPANGRSLLGIYLFDLSNGEQTFLTETTSTWTRPRISGNKVLYANYYPTSAASGKRVLMMHDIKTGAKTNITETLATFDNSFDIDGGILVWEDNREGDPGSIYLLTLEMGGIFGKSYPSGAEMVVDYQNMGITPKTVAPLSPGPHTVLFSKNGYSPVKVIVDVREGEIVNITANLTPIISPSATASPTISAPSPRAPTVNPRIPSSPASAKPSVGANSPIPRSSPDGYGPIWQGTINPSEFIGGFDGGASPTMSGNASPSAAPKPSPKPSINSAGLPNWVWFVALLALMVGAYYIYRRKKEADENSEEEGGGY